MKNNNLLSQNDTFRKFEILTHNFGAPTDTYEHIYEQYIKPITESPYMFNTYHWTTNIAERRIIDMMNVKKALGYDERHFTLAKSMDIIHPHFKDLVLEYALVAYRMLRDDPKYRLHSAQTHYSVQFPVQHYEGHYLLVQMNISIIQTDEAGNPLANYNRFAILDDYEDAPLHIKPHVYFETNNLTLAKTAEKELYEKMKGFILKMTKMSKQEIAILERLYNHKKLDEIASELNITVDTVKTHNKNILAKAKEHYSPQFTTVREVAKYLCV